MQITRDHASKTFTVGCKQFMMIPRHRLHFELIRELRPYFRGVIGKMQGGSGPDEPNSSAIVTRAGNPARLSPRILEHAASLE